MSFLRTLARSSTPPAGPPSPSASAYLRLESNGSQNATSINNGGAGVPTVADLQGWYAALHNDGSASAPFGHDGQGASRTTLAAKLLSGANALTAVSNYRNGSYVSQGSGTSDPNHNQSRHIEAFWPLMIATWWPTNGAGTAGATVHGTLTAGSTTVTVDLNSSPSNIYVPGTAPAGASQVSTSISSYVTWIRIDNEIIRLSNAAGDMTVASGVLTLANCVRGQWGTGAPGGGGVQHAAGTKVFSPVYIGLGDRGNLYGLPLPVWASGQTWATNDFVLDGGTVYQSNQAGNTLRPSTSAGGSTAPWSSVSGMQNWPVRYALKIWDTTSGPAGALGFAGWWVLETVGLPASVASTVGVQTGGFLGTDLGGHNTIHTDVTSTSLFNQYNILGNGSSGAQSAAGVNAWDDNTGAPLQPGTTMGQYQLNKNSAIRAQFTAVGISPLPKLQANNESGSAMLYDPTNAGAAEWGTFENWLRTGAGGALETLSQWQGDMRTLQTVMANDRGGVPWVRFSNGDTQSFVDQLKRLAYGSYLLLYRSGTTRTMLSFDTNPGTASGNAFGTYAPDDLFLYNLGSVNGGNVASPSGYTDAALSGYSDSNIAVAGSNLYVRTTDIGAIIVCADDTTAVGTTSSTRYVKVFTAFYDLTATVTGTTGYAHRTTSGGSPISASNPYRLAIGTQDAAFIIYG